MLQLTAEWQAKGAAAFPTFPTYSHMCRSEARQLGKGSPLLNPTMPHHFPIIRFWDEKGAAAPRGQKTVS